MLRRVLLVVMATVISYVLTACSGYVLYTISEGRSEAHLSLMVRFLFNPLIALAVGVLVGLLSSDHPALTLVVGLTPWALMLRGPGRGGSVSGLRAFLGGMLVYFALGAVAAAFAWRLRHKSADDLDCRREIAIAIALTDRVLSVIA